MINFKKRAALKSALLSTKLFSFIPKNEFTEMTKKSLEKSLRLFGEDWFLFPIRRYQLCFQIPFSFRTAWEIK